MICPNVLSQTMENCRDRVLKQGYEHLISKQYGEACSKLKGHLRRENKKSQQPRGDQQDISLQSLTLLMIGMASYRINDFILCRIIARFQMDHERNEWLQMEFMFLMVQSLQQLSQFKECLQYIESLLKQIDDDEYQEYQQLKSILLKKQQYIQEFLLNQQALLSMNEEERIKLGQKVHQLELEQLQNKYFDQIGYPVYLVASSWLIRFNLFTKQTQDFQILKNNEMEEELFIEALKDQCLPELYEELEFYASTQPEDLLVTPIFNDDLLDLQYHTNDPLRAKNYTNYRLKQELRENLHFNFVSAPVWRELYQHFGGCEVRRTVIPQGNSVRVETQLMLIRYQIYPSEDGLQFAQINSNERIHDLIEKIQRIHSIKVSSVWRCESFDQKLMNGKMIPREYTMDFAEIGIEDQLVFEQEGQVMEQLKNEKEIKVANICQFCKRQDNELYFCECLHVKYCNQICQSNDRKNHQDECKKRLNKDQYLNQLQKKYKVKGPSKLNKLSAKGLCGLSNLGNTCFMNSSLQCLSHVIELTEFMIQNEFLQDINEKNPLGTGGRLACAYSELLKELWENNNNSVAPWNLKSVIGKYAPQFSGYSQQDSAELLNYVLDGLHEDLNRVKKKPYLPEVEYQNQNDQDLSKIYWDNNLLRNDSIITELFTGQFKSRVECPDCQYISITFDPFVSVSLPIPTQEYQTLNFYLIFRDSNTIPLRFSQQLLTTVQAGEIIANISEFKNLKKEYLRFYHLQDSTIVDQGIPNHYTVKQIRDSPYTIFLYEIYDEKLDSSQDYLIQLNVFVKQRKDLQKVSYTRQFFISNQTTPQQLQLIIYQLIKPFLLFLCEQSHLTVSKELEQFLRAVKKLDYKTIEEEFQSFIRIKDVYEILDFPTVISSSLKLSCVFHSSIRHDQLKLNRCVDSDYGTQQKPVPHQTNLVDCLHQFSQEEILEQGNEWYCSKCKGHKRAKKQMQIYMAPQILILHLKRFRSSKVYSYGSYYMSGGSSKITQFVDYPIENLNLNGFILKKNQQCVYDLFAVSNHFGGLGGGHYTAYAKNVTQWYDFNDSNVRELRQSPVSDSAYVLFYRRRK